MDNEFLDGDKAILEYIHDTRAEFFKSGQQDHAMCRKFESDLGMFVRVRSSTYKDSDVATRAKMRTSVSDVFIDEPTFLNRIIAAYDAVEESERVVAEQPCECCLVNYVIK